MRDFKAGAARVEALCRAVGETMLVDVERRRLYELPQFQEVQAAHMAKVRLGLNRVGCGGLARLQGRGKLRRL